MKTENAMLQIDGRATAAPHHVFSYFQLTRIASAVALKRGAVTPAWLRRGTAPLFAVAIFLSNVVEAQEGVTGDSSGCVGSTPECPNKLPAVCRSGAWVCEECDGIDEDGDQTAPNCDLASEIGADCVQPPDDVGQHELCNTSTSPTQCGFCREYPADIENTPGTPSFRVVWSAQCEYSACAPQARLSLSVSGNVLTVRVSGALPDYPYRISFSDPTAPSIGRFSRAKTRTVRTNSSGQAATTFGFGSCVPTTGLASHLLPARAAASVTMSELGIRRTSVFAATVLPVASCR